MKKLITIAISILLSYITYAQSNLIKNVTITVDTTLLKTKTVKMGMVTNLYHLDGTNSKFNYVTPSTWHYVVITKDNNLNSNIYIDGVLSNTEIYGSRAFNWYKLYLGASYYTSFNNYFKGWIDDLRISNTVRTSTEILANYNSNLPLTKDANTVSLWKFDETSGKNFSNQVQGLTNGTLNGNAQFQQGKFSNAVYFDGVNSYGDCNYDMPESNVTLEFWVKLDGIKSPETIIQPYGMYSGDVTFATDTVFTNTSKNITWSTGEKGYSIIVDPKTTPSVWVTNGVNKDTINFNNKCSNQSTLPNYISTNGLIAYYPLNNDTKDYSGNNNDGINNGATLTTDRFGNQNSAYSFNGTSNYFQFSDNKLPTGNSNRSFSMWIKYHKPNSYWASLLYYGTATLKGEHNLLLINQNGILDFDYFNLNSITTDSVVKQNEWYHLVYIFDNAIGTQIYINGKLQDLSIGKIALNTNNINSINTTSNGSMYIGRSSQISAYPYFFKGSIDDIKIYNRALSQTEINSIVNENVCISNITVTDTLKISSISGINELPENFGLVKVYPNPTKDVINIVASNPSSNYSIQIVNNLGTVVYTGSLSNPSSQVNLNTLGKGMYYIKILDISNNVLDTRKLVLE